MFLLDIISLMLYDQWPWLLQESGSGFTYNVHYLNVLTFSISDLSNILPTWSNIWTGIRQKEYQWNNIALDNILCGRCGLYFQSFWKLSVVVIEWKLTIEMLNWKLQPSTSLYLVIMKYRQIDKSTFYVHVLCLSVSYVVSAEIFIHPAWHIYNLQFIFTEYRRWHCNIYITM